MVRSTQDRAADDIPGPLNAARDRGILVGQQNVAQMAFAEDYDMINAFPPDWTDQAFCVGVLPSEGKDAGRSRMPIDPTRRTKISS